MLIWRGFINGWRKAGLIWSGRQGVMNASAGIRSLFNRTLESGVCRAKVRKDSINRTTLVAAVVLVSLLAAGGLLVLKNANAPAKEAAIGADVRTDARDLDAAPPDIVRRDTQTGPAESAGTVRLSGEVPRALNRSRKIYRENSGTEPLDAYDRPQANRSAGLREISRRSPGSRVAHLPAIPESR